MSEDIVKFIRRRDYKYIKELGHGSCGKTVLLYDDVIEQHFVCKKFEPEDPGLKEEMYPGFMNEIRLMHQTYHPNLVRIFGYHVEPQHHIGYILMEYVEGETVDKYIALNRDGFESVFRQTVAAFRHLEENNILHRDLRNTNILVRNDGTVKVIDLGFGKSIKTDADFKKSVSLNWPFTWPQEFLDQTYDFRTEVYAVGKLFMTILTKELLLEKDLEPVIRRMCAESPTQRISSFAEVQLALDKSNLYGPHFTEEEKAVYRGFAYDLTNCLSGIEYECEYITDLPTIVARLETTYQDCMLEEETSVFPIAKCFVTKGFLKAHSKRTFSVVNLRDFLELIKSRDVEGQRILLANIRSRLDGVSRYQDDEIPF